MLSFLASPQYVVMKRFCELIQLYGIVIALQRVSKAILWKLFRFTWEKCYLMSRINGKLLSLQHIDNSEIRELKRDDLFGNTLWREYLIGNSQYVSQCFDLDYAKPYGIYIDGTLAYVTWILYDHIEREGQHTEATGCAMQWYAYCLPEFRGKGIHSFGKAWAINEMTRNGVKKCYASTLAYNRPALKTQEKLGFSVEDTFYIISFGKKKIYKLIR